MPFRIDLPKILTGCFLLISFLSWCIGDGYFGLSRIAFYPHTLLTYPFVGSGAFFDTLFSAFFFWVTLSTLSMRFSERRLLLIFLAAALFVGGLSLLILWLTKSFFMLAGPSPLIYALLTLLLLSDRHIKILLLGLLPIEPTTIVVIMLGINTLQNLVAGSYFQVTANLLGVLFAFAAAPLLKKRTHKIRRF